MHRVIHKLSVLYPTIPAKACSAARNVSGSRHFTDKDDIWVLAQLGPQCQRKVGNSS